jgi:RNA polymerase sigma factor (sigma-70 family)
VTRGKGKSTRPAGGKLPSLEEAFEQFQPELLGALVCLLGNLEDARDALQESFLKCWRHRDQLAEIDNLRAWIFRIVLNTGRDVRGAAWRRKRQALPEEETMVAAPQASPLEQLTTLDEAERIRLAVRDLREEEQEVFLLKQNAELTYEEIALEIGIPLGTVKTRMRMALMKLRSTLNARET